jgi:hypothetical protein
LAALQSCFVAGTPVEGPHGARAIESYRSYEECGEWCDSVVSRGEHDPDGVLRVRRVLRRFERRLRAVTQLSPETPKKTIFTPLNTCGRPWRGKNVPVGLRTVGPQRE